MMTDYEREARKQFAEVVAAWADGAEIQSCAPRSEATWQDRLNPVFMDNFSWRIKPQTIRYRVGISRSEENGVIYAVSVDNAADEECEQSYQHFIRWLTDWQEVEV
jgi:hypothetical protein